MDGKTIIEIVVQFIFFWCVGWGLGHILCEIFKPSTIPQLLLVLIVGITAILFSISILSN